MAQATYVTNTSFNKHTHVRHLHISSSKWQLKLLSFPVLTAYMHFDFGIRFPVAESICSGFRNLAFWGHCSWAVNGENRLATVVNEWNQSRDVFLRDWISGWWISVIVWLDAHYWLLVGLCLVGWIALVGQIQIQITKILLLQHNQHFYLDVGFVE